MKNIYLINTLILLLILPGLNSCEPKSKKYIYTEIERVKGIFDSDWDIERGKAKEISAISDSEAYLIAYKKFAYGAKIAIVLTEKVGGKIKREALKFELLNPSGIDISETTTFENKELLELKIQEEVSKHKLSIENW